MRRLPTLAERHPHGLPMEQEARLVALFDALGLDGADGLACVRRGDLSIEEAADMVADRFGIVLQHRAARREGDAAPAAPPSEAALPEGFRLGDAATAMCRGRGPSACRKGSSCARAGGCVYAGRAP